MSKSAAVLCAALLLSHSGVSEIAHGGKPGKQPPPWVVELIGGDSGELELLALSDFVKPEVVRELGQQRENALSSGIPSYGDVARIDQRRYRQVDLPQKKELIKLVWGREQVTGLPAGSAKSHLRGMIDAGAVWVGPKGIAALSAGKRTKERNWRLLCVDAGNRVWAVSHDPSNLKASGDGAQVWWTNQGGRRLTEVRHTAEYPDVVEIAVGFGMKKVLLSPGDRVVRRFRTKWMQPTALIVNGTKHRISAGY